MRRAISWGSLFGDDSGLSRAQRRWLDVALYVGVAMLVTLLAAQFLGFFARGLDVPISYSADTLLTSTSIKGIIENGQPFTNPHLAAPGTGEILDFPGADGIFILEFWLLSRFTSEYAVVLNLFALLSYPLIALAAAWSLRMMRFSRPSAFVFAALYAFLPFHQSRLVNHQSLSAYFMIPLAVMLAAVVVFELRPSGGAAPQRRFLGLPWWGWLVVLGLGAGGIYYAFFAIVLVLLAGLISALVNRRLKNLVPAVAIVVGIVVVLFLQYVPSLVFWQLEGRNNTADARSSGEADLYALRMIQLVLPVSGHRLAPLARLKDSFRESLGALTPIYNGIAYDSSLGVIGVVGFLTLLFWVATVPFRGPPDPASTMPEKLAFLGLACFLLGTVGGVGEILAVLGFAQIRAYDRITPYIAFISLAACAWLADAFLRRVRGDSLLKALTVTACFSAVFALGFLDQATPAIRPNYDVIEAEFANDRAFVAQVEATAGNGASVFQLPYVPYPESEPVHGTAAYDPLKMYLHSKSIHWSAGAFKGRETADWQSRVSAEPAGQLVASLRQSDFAGLVVDRFGYEDQGAALEDQLGAALGATPTVVSADERYAYYALGR